MARRIFIGDVHGHYDGLMRLLDHVNVTADDHIYFVGDLIDRGPKSADVVEFVRQSGHRCVLGNHEQLLLDSFPNDEIYTPALQGWLYSGGQATLASYADTDTLLDHIAWFRQLPLYLDLTDVWLVHAGVDPKLPLKQQTSHEFCWIRNAFHSNATPYFPDKTIITGHTITFTFTGVPPGQIVQGAGWLDIDTGAYHPRSGWLTALDWDGQLVHQVQVFDQVTRTRPLEEAITPLNQAMPRPQRTRIS